MVTSTNKGYELIVPGSETGTWGTKLNTDVFGFIDENLGGVTAKSLTNVNVNLTAAESRTLRLVLSGTLTGNVLVTTLAVGMTIIENNCTGAFTVTFQKFGVGSPVTIPNSTANLVTTGASGNPTVVGVDFPTGTRIPFQQTTPPPGYTKDTTTSGLNNSAMKMTTGTPAVGGSVDFSTAFASQTPTGTVGATTLDASQIPAHQHFLFNVDSSVTLILPTTYPARIRSSGGSGDYNMCGTATLATEGLSSTVGGGGSHTHSLTMNAINLAVRFTEFCIGVKI